MKQDRRSLTKLEVERRSSVQDNLKTGLLHNLIESIELGDIGNNDDLELAAAGLIGVGLADVLRFVFRPDGGNHGVALGEKLLEDVGCPWKLLAPIHCSSISQHVDVRP